MRYEIYDSEVPFEFDRGLGDIYTFSPEEREILKSGEELIFTDRTWTKMGKQVRCYVVMEYDLDEEKYVLGIYNKDPE